MRHFEFLENGETHSIEFSYLKEEFVLKVGGQTFPCDGATIVLDGKRFPFWVHQTPEHTDVWLAGEVYRFHPIDPRRRDQNQHSTGPGDGRLLAEMPGKILSLSVCQGQQVDEGATLLIMESMKMELSITAPFSGVVTEILVHDQQMVTQGGLLLVLTPPQEPRDEPTESHREPA